MSPPPYSRPFNLTVPDVFRWMEINQHSFTNNKRQIVNAERARRTLTNQSPLIGRQGQLLAHLKSLTRNPVEYLEVNPHPVCLGWTLTELDTNVRRFGQA